LTELARADEASPPLRALAGFPASKDEEGAYPSPLIAWYGMFVFFLAQVVATMDRGILSFVAEPVRHDLGATDVQISLLQGLAFAIFYATVGLPLGMIADIVSRRRMLIGGILIWSTATLLTGLSQSFGEMFVCRLFVGLGEATLGPCAISMMADLFPSSKRGRPMSVYLLGGTISGGLAIMLTGLFMGLPVETIRRVPLIGGLVPWRLTFLLSALLGIVNALLLLLLPEIGRRGPLLARKGFGIRAVAHYFRTRWRLFLPLYLAAGLWSMGSSSASAWGVTYMVRRFGASLPFIGQRLGVLNMAAALLGSFVASVVLTHIIRRHGIDGKLRLTPLLPLIATPCALILFAPTIQVALLLAAVPSLVLPLYGSTLLSSLSDLVPADMRGVSVSIYAFAGTMIGGTFGPLGVALISDRILHDPTRLGLAILLVAVPALLVSSLLFLLCRRGRTA
jgi:MFS family permease